VVTCPRCGKENPDGFQFCGFCTASLTEVPPALAAEERKVVSVLFCDLVGFTAASDAADPEDVRARIRPYHARLRREIERYGGTVEKFVGDAVMAAFGAPVAHEDDAERAVRAGLRILEAIHELNETEPSLSLQVRIGINTGEAVVALGAKPEAGEGMVTGDVVNTASRLQASAPVDAIAVSDATYRATERVFTYEELDPVQVKGKAKPLAVWQPLAARARFGADVMRTHTTPLVGRELEKPLLIGTFERAAQQRSCQLVTVVGEPGVGKSRLCSELFRYIDERPGLVTWRQGRCLPYGDGIAFWALGEIVKAQCAILESDSPEVAAAKLDDALPANDPDRAWLKARLAPLVGAGGEPAAQQESFTAWRRFLESIASQRPAVLVFEDLHWADEALLSFLEYLADWSEGVPLLLLCAARPELFEHRPHFGANARNAQRINLTPLSDDETARLLSLLLEQAVLPAEAQRTLLERTGGNPLYAEEFARLLADRGLIAGELDDVPFPDSVQALIAARLDTLSPERKSLLQDAAVLGKVFWAGALAEIGRREPPEVELALHELTRKELVRPARTSSMEGEAEYSFWHVLVRDVGYAQIPRAARAARHRAAAAWIEAKGGERVEDLADVLAHHYLRALDLVRSTGQTADVDELEERARRYLALAGERSLALDVASAEASLARALELAPAGHPERARLLERWAQAAQQQGRLEEARAALEEAIALYRQGEEPLAAGQALTTLVIVLWAAADSGRRKERMAEALELLEAQAPGPELVAAYGELAGMHYINEAFPDAIAAAERALQLASELGLPEPTRALGFGAGARCYLGEHRSLEDVRRALALSLDRGKGREAAVHYSNLATDTSHYEGPAAALAACREARAFCERRGIFELGFVIGSYSLIYEAELGGTAAALARAGPVAEEAEVNGIAPALIVARGMQLRLQAERGERAQVSEAERLAVRARTTGVPWEILFGLAAASQALLAAGDRTQAQVLLSELAQLLGRVRTGFFAHVVLPDVVRCALKLSEPELAAQLTRAFEPHTPAQKHAAVACRSQVAEAAGNLAEAVTLYTDAAQGWHRFGNVPERAHALLGRGRCLLALGKSGADVPLGEARVLFASLGYRPAVTATDALLGEARAAAL
jgi:class 3 adenylate cyclase/tetratricopeptide (TPR) repeat protein